MTNKSGFEIRADLLNQAQGILECNLQRKIDAVHTHNDLNPDDKQELPTETISTTDVVAAARDLYAFVNEKQ